MELFKQRIREDKDVQHQLEEELGPEVHEHFAGKKVLIVDHIEFEGVSAMFTRTILNEAYSPASIGYFEFGSQFDTMPTGLDNPIPDPSYIAKESQDPVKRRDVEVLRRELARLAVMA